MIEGSKWFSIVSLFVSNPNSGQISYRFRILPIYGIYQNNESSWRVGSEQFLGQSNPAPLWDHDLPDLGCLWTPENATCL